MAVPAALEGRVATVAALGGVVALGAFLRFWAIGRQGLWFDEATTAWLVRGSPAELLSRLPHTESTPPLYYLLAWGWVRVFGDTAAGLRSLSALAGVASVFATFGAARVLVGRRPAVIAALLVAVNPILIWYSQEARSYSLLVLASAVSLWLFARARAQPSQGRLVAWGAVAAAALCVHYFALFVVLPEAALLLADPRVALRERTLAVGIPALAAAALAALAHAQSGRVYRFTHIPLGARVRQVVQYFAVGFSPPSGRTVLAVAGCVLLAALGLLALRTTRHERWGGALAAVVGGSAVVVPILLAALGIDYLNARNVIGAVVPLAVLVAAGLGAARAGRAGLALAAVLVAISVAMVADTTGDVYAQRPHWQQVARALTYTGTPRAIVMLRGHTWSRPLAFYLPRTWWPPHGGALVREIDVLRKVPHTGPCPTGVWWGALCNVGFHSALKAPPVRGFRFLSSEKVAGFAIDRYRSPRPVRVYSQWPLDKRTSLRVDTRIVMVTPTKAPSGP